VEKEGWNKALKEKGIVSIAPAGARTDILSLLSRREESRWRLASAKLVARRLIDLVENISILPLEVSTPTTTVSKHLWRKYIKWLRPWTR